MRVYVRKRGGDGELLGKLKPSHEKRKKNYTTPVR